MATYKDRGVSAKKEDVHAAIKNSDKGAFPGAFCKLFPDYLTESSEHCIIQHADGAGTKTSLGYMMYKETGDASVFASLAQDSLVMNIDDALCVGCTGPFMVTNTIGRNAKNIPGGVIQAVIEGYEKVASTLKEFNIEIINVGGETADVGDLVRTIILDSTLTARMKRKHVINCNHVQPGHVIVGLASYGQATYEDKENSGMGSNGLTLARHELLSDHYKTAFPESFAPEIEPVAYTGSFRLQDPLPGSSLTVGEALLSPTRTFSPLIKAILDQHRDKISAIHHNTGGGQTKCLHFGEHIHYIKDNLIPMPPLFKTIADTTSLSEQELYQTFNMGGRMDIICAKDIVDEIISSARFFNIHAQVVGRVESSQGPNTLTLHTPNGIIEVS